MRVLKGRVYGGQTDDPESVYACQCRIVSDLRVAVERVPDIDTVPGVITEVRRLASDVYEVCAEPLKKVEYIPGQY
ncbi:hypothetical protein, partial [Pandoraea pneumonica]|uniref:hypothetical protein n=1 Tax=Pandoraea pneumonica TaxID=2508299 RepID=UPI003CF77354